MGVIEHLPHPKDSNPSILVSTVEKLDTFSESALNLSGSIEPLLLRPQKSGSRVSIVASQGISPNNANGHANSTPPHSLLRGKVQAKRTGRRRTPRRQDVSTTCRSSEETFIGVIKTTRRLNVEINYGFTFFSLTPIARDDGRAEK